MKIEFITNVHFVRNKQSNIKISVRANDIYFFCIHYNITTRKFQHQAFVEDHKFDWKNIFGETSSVYYSGLQSLYESWNKLTDIQKKNVLLTAHELNKHMKKFVEHLSFFTQEDKKYILDSVSIYFDYIQKFYYNNPVVIIPDHQKIFSNEKSSTVTKESGIMKWKPLDASKVSNDYITNLVIEMRKNDGKETIYDAKIFRLKDGMLEFFGIEDDDILSKENNINPAPAIQKQKIRNTISMFKIINANNLNSLFAGNFYPVVRKDGDYYIIKDDNGNEYTIRNNRGKIVNVYQDKPE